MTPTAATMMTPHHFGRRRQREIGKPAQRLHPRDCGIDDPLRYDLLAAKDPGFALEAFEFPSTISGTQVGVAAKAPRGWSNLSEVNAAA